MTARVRRHDTHEHRACGSTSGPQPGRRCPNRYRRLLRRDPRFAASTTATSGEASAAANSSPQRTYGEESEIQPHERCPVRAYRGLARRGQRGDRVGGHRPGATFHLACDVIPPASIPADRASLSHTRASPSSRVDGSLDGVASRQCADRIRRPVRAGPAGGSRPADERRRGPVLVRSRTAPQVSPYTTCCICPQASRNKEHA